MSYFGSAFDNQFLFKKLMEITTYREKPKIVLNGSKIVLMTFLNIKFIDTFNYFYLPLLAPPKSDGLIGIVRGWFPHLFNLLEYQNYVGTRRKRNGTSLWNGIVKK